jgi:hypothetical protein
MGSILRHPSGRRLLVIGSVAVGVLALASAALAAVPLTVVSQDPYTNASSYHQTQLEPDTFSFGSTIVATFQSGRFTDGGSSNLGWATSTDNGATWTHGFLPGTTIFATPAGPWARISDPSVAYDPADDVWMIAGLTLDSTATGRAVVVSRSTDGGLTWQNPVTVASTNSSFFDKDWITCDTWSGSPAYGNCYVEWDDFGTGNTLKMSRSTDGGLHWAASSAPNSGVIGGQPVVQPNGTVVVPIDDAFESRVESFVSTNGGVSYSGPFTVATLDVHFPAGNLRNDALPSAEVDGSGRVYVAWEDCRFRSSCNADDVVFSSSSNGRNWSPVSRVPIAPASTNADFFLPGIGVDRSTSGSSAHIGITFAFYPQRSCTTSTCNLGAGFIGSTDGGATWGTPVALFTGVKLGWLPLTDQGYMVGDYISTSFGSNGRAYPVIANASAGSCSLGQITSCHEFMVAPTGGLSLGVGTRRAELDRRVATGAGRSVSPKSAF